MKEFIVESREKNNSICTSGVKAETKEDAMAKVPRAFRAWEGRQVYTLAFPDMDDTPMECAVLYYEHPNEDEGEHGYTQMLIDACNAAKEYETTVFEVWGEYEVNGNVLGEPFWLPAFLPGGKAASFDGCYRPA